MPNYKKPGWFTQHVFNPAVALASRLGISLAGSRRLTVKGRKSGKPHTVPVNPLKLGDETYLVAPRGHTQWVRNLRVATTGELQVGRRIQTFRAVEMANAAKPQILREYLRLWKAEVGVFFNGISADATDDELLAIAPGYPVFVIENTAA